MFAKILLTVLILLSGSFVTTKAQSQQSPPPPPQSQPYTIQANSRVVLTDVTVTDRNGNPVRGLPKSAFQIFDNKNPQTIASFEEHRGTPAAMPIEPVAIAKGTYSNEYLEHLPPVLNVVIIDIANLEITDQMYLNYELTQFLKTPLPSRWRFICEPGMAAFCCRTLRRTARCCWPRCTRRFRAFRRRDENI
jgi:hypothetical protein